MSSHWYLYDYQVHYYDLPTSGILRGERTLLRFAGANYTDPRYADVYYTFDAWGNRDSVSAHRSEGTLTALYQGTASVTTTCYGQYSGETCTADNYHTFVGWERNAVGHYTRYQYDYAYAQPVWMSDANEQITQAAYDAFGRMTKVAKPGDTLTNPTVGLAYYDTATPFYTEATQRIDASTSFTVRKYYNGMGWLLQTRVHNAVVGGVLRDIQVDSFYNAMGKVSQQSAPYDVATTASFARSSSSSIRTSTTYDALGRVVRVLAPDTTQHNTAYAFDGSANRSIVKSFDPRYPATDAYATKSYTDAWGRTRLVQPPTGPGVSYTYDALDRLTDVYYGSAYTNFSYDYAGRKRGTIDADMGTWYYSYDASSNLTNQTDARGCVTSLTYDLLNRPTGKSYSGNCGTGGTSVTYGYDVYSPANAQWGRGQRTGMSDSSGSTSWMYDPRGRLRWESKTITGSGTFITEWSYNSADLVDWMKYPSGNGGQQGEQVNFTYVPQMLVKTAVGYTTYVKNATYDAAGRTDLLHLGLNTITSNSYMYLDYSYYAWNVQGGRLQWLQGYQTADAALRQKLEYAYDAAGNVDWIKDHLASAPDDPYQLQDFTYDLLNRLDAASAAGGDGQGLYNENYDYDSQGNLWKKGIPGSETVYTYLDGAHKHAVTHLGGAPMYGYDANGNMTTRKVGATTYTQGWDAENRLVTVSGTGVSASFSYDGDGVRVKGTVNGTVTAYVSNWFEWTGSTSTMKKYYYAGSQRIAMRTGSGTGTSGLLWIIGDHLGSTTKIANVDGSINSQRRYKPWGEWRFGGTMSTTFAFTGQRQEDQLGGTDGLYYYGARWYDAALGRWLSPDSIIPEAAQGVQAWSRHTYVNNAPTRYQDPTGHSVDCAVGESGCEAGEYNPNTAQAVPDPTIILPTAKDIFDVLVPDSGTVGVGISGTAGAAIYLNISLGAYVDSSGDAAIGFSVGGGGLLPGAAEVAAFYSATNAETVNQLKGWSMTLGGSIEADGSVGGDRIWFSDKSAGKKFDGYSVTVGLGAAAPVPAEGHVGVNHMWLTPTLNLYDIAGLPRP